MDSKSAPSVAVDGSKLKKGLWETKLSRWYHPKLEKIMAEQVGKVVGFQALIVNVLVVLRRR